MIMYRASGGKRLTNNMQLSLLFLLACHLAQEGFVTACVAPP